MPEAGNPRAFLDVRLGDEPARRFPLHDSQAVVGRSPECAISLDHPTVSRRHAEITCDPFGRWWVRDLLSTNGTQVNGSPVLDIRAVGTGDIVQVGDFLIELRLPGRRPIPSGPPAAMPPERRRDSRTMIRTLTGTSAPPKLDASHLGTILDLGQQLATIPDPKERLAAMCRMVVSKELRGDRAVAVRVRESGPKLLCRAQARDGWDGPPEPRLSRRALGAVMRRKVPLLASSSRPSPERLDLTLLDPRRPLAVIVCPLHEERPDFLYVELPDKVGTDEWLALFALVAEAYQNAEAVWEARHAAQTNALVERELEMAREIQERLVPRGVTAPGLDLAIGFEPCRWVGGDYVDVVPMPDGRILLAVGDVCGKGMQASLISSSLHTLIRALVDTGRSLPDILGRVNRHLAAYLPDTSFVTLVAAALDPRTGALECANCGHPPPLVIAPNGAFRTLQSEINPALGMLPSVAIISETGRLPSDDVLALYTDGVTEMRDGEDNALGVDRLGRGLGEIRVAAPEGTMDVLASSLQNELDLFRGRRPPSDDTALLLAKRVRRTDIPPQR